MAGLVFFVGLNASAGEHRLNLLEKSGVTVLDAVDGVFGLAKIGGGVLIISGSTLAGPAGMVVGYPVGGIVIAHGACDIGSAGNNAFIEWKYSKLPEHSTCLGKVTAASLKKMKVNPAKAKKIAGYADAGDGVLSVFEIGGIFKFTADARVVLLDPSVISTLGVTAVKGVGNSQRSTASSVDFRKSSSNAAN